MSRIGKKEIVIPSNVKVEYNNNTLKVTGPTNTLSMNVSPLVKVNIDNNILSFTIDNENDKKQKSHWGTMRANANNLVEGVTKGFEKTLELNGVGYKMELSKDLVLYIGFSHPVVIKVPELIKLELNKNILKGTSPDKQLLGDFFTTIHNMKSCDVYKQKGFKFPGRFYRSKAGKKGKK